MKKKKYKILSIVLIILMIIFFKYFLSDLFLGAVKKLPYDVENMEVLVEVNDKKQYEVIEKLDISFNGTKNYIQTDLLGNSDSSCYSVSGISVSGVDYELYGSNIVLKSNGYFKKSKKQVTIKYTLNCYKDEDKTKDKMIIDVLRSKWPLTIKHFNAVIKYPPYMHMQNVNLSSESSYYAKNGNQYLNKAECNQQGNVINVKADNIVYKYAPITVNATFENNAFMKAPEKKVDYIINDEETNIGINKAQEYMVNKKYKITVNNSDVKINLKQFLSSHGVLKIHDVRCKNENIRYESNSEYLYLPNDKGIYEFTVSYIAIPVLDDDIIFNLRDHSGLTDIKKSKFIIKSEVPIKDYNVMSNVKYNSSKKNNEIIVENTEDLKCQGNITVNIITDKNAFSRPSPITTYLSVVTAALCVLVALFRFFRYGRDPKVTPVVGVYPPEGLNTVETAFILNGAMKSSDITSLIFYWASHKHLNIIMDNDGEKAKFTLEKVSDLDNRHRDYEIKLFNKIFSKGDGRRVTSDQLRRNLLGEIFKARLKVQFSFRGDRSLEDELAQKKSSKTLYLCCITIIPLIITRLIASYIEFNKISLALILFVSFFSMIIFYCFASSLNNLYRLSNIKKIRNIVVAALAGSIIFAINYKIYSHRIIPWYVTAGSILLMMTGLFISAFITRISKYKAKLAGEVLGFKIFLETAEKDRLEMLINDDPNYFYDVLPYAQVLNVTNTWTDKFKDITLIPPSWYKSTAKFTFNVLFDILIHLAL